MLLWAGNSIVGRAVRFDVPPLTLAFVRWLGASLILLPFADRAAAARLAGDPSRVEADLRLGLLGVGAFNALLYSGLRYTTATNALLLQAAIPALVCCSTGCSSQCAAGGCRPSACSARRSACWRSCSRAAVAKR
jgi:drug/metabolite transporter (DMT)-like permease